MCTAIKMNFEGGSVMGRTMDIEAPTDYNVIYMPRGYGASDNLMGGKYPSKYRMMGVGFGNRDPLKDGVNEKGLIGITNDYSGKKLFSEEVKPDKPNVSSYHFNNFVLGNYGSVDELLADLPNIHLSSHDYEGNKVITPTFHWIFTDASQRCVVIEPENRQLKVHDNPYGVMTNAPKFDKHAQAADDLFDMDDLDEFNGAKKLPGGYDPRSRFLKAYYQSQTSLKSYQPDQALGRLYPVLQAVALPPGFIKNTSYHSITFTQYISAYDTQNKKLTVKDADNPMVYSLTFDAIEEPEERLAIYINQKFDSQPLK